MKEFKEQIRREYADEVKTLEGLAQYVKGCEVKKKKDGGEFDNINRAIVGFSICRIYHDSFCLRFYWGSWPRDFSREIYVKGEPTAENIRAELERLPAWCLEQAKKYRGYLDRLDDWAADYLAAVLSVGCKIINEGGGDVLYRIIRGADLTAYDCEQYAKDKEKEAKPDKYTDARRAYILENYRGELPKEGRGAIVRICADILRAFETDRDNRDKSCFDYWGAFRRWAFGCPSVLDFSGVICGGPEHFKKQAEKLTEFAGLLANHFDNGDGPAYDVAAVNELYNEIRRTANAWEV